MPCGAKDDEFAVLEPKITNVLKLGRDVGGLNFMALFGRGGGRRGGGNMNSVPTRRPRPFNRPLRICRPPSTSRTPVPTKSKPSSLSFVKLAQRPARITRAAQQDRNCS